AEAVLAPGLEMARQCHGERHAFYAMMLGNFAAVVVSRGDPVRARPLVERALAIQRATLSRKHPDLAITLINLGALFSGMGDRAAAARAYEEALGVLESHPSKADQYGAALNNLGAVLTKMNELDRAGEVLEEALDHTRSQFGEGHPRYHSVLLNL